MASKKRIWASHAISRTFIAFSVGELDDENPFSSILIFREESELRWGFVDVPRTIVSITSMPGNAKSEEIFVAMSNEGDVYFLEGDVRNEKIPGAGVLSDDAVGRGSMTRIRHLKDRLFACGRGSQVYRRDEPDGWIRIGEGPLPGDEVCAFEDIEILAGGAIVLCGATDVKYRQPSPDELRELERIKAEGPNSRFLRYRQEVRRMEHGVVGCLAFWRNNAWSFSELPTGQDLRALKARDPDVIAVGDGGTMLLAADPETLEDLSQLGLTETFRAVRLHGGKIYVLGDDSIWIFKRDFSNDGAIGLPELLTNPQSFDVVDGAIWYFDYDGIARYSSDRWEIFDIPAELRNRGP